MSELIGICTRWAFSPARTTSHVGRQRFRGDHSLWCDCDCRSPPPPPNHENDSTKLQALQNTQCQNRLRNERNEPTSCRPSCQYNSFAWRVRERERERERDTHYITLAILFTHHSPFTLDPDTSFSIMTKWANCRGRSSRSESQWKRAEEGALSVSFHSRFTLSVLLSSQFVSSRRRENIYSSPVSVERFFFYFGSLVFRCLLSCRTCATLVLAMLPWWGQSRWMTLVNYCCWCCDFHFTLPSPIVPCT